MLRSDDLWVIKLGDMIGIHMYAGAGRIKEKTEKDIPKLIILFMMS